MLASRNAIKQRQEAGAKAVERKKAQKKIDIDLWYWHEHDDYNTNEWEDNQFDGEANLDKMENLNI